MAIIAVAGRKGGIGKSTIAGNLAGEFVYLGRSVVVLDADPQHSIAEWSEQGEGLLAQCVLKIEGGQAGVVKANAKAAAASADMVIIDTPPGMPDVIYEAAMVADLVLLPCGPSHLDLFPLKSAIALTLKARAARRSKKPRVRLVPSRVSMNTNLGRSLQSSLEERMGKKVMPPISQRVIVAEAVASGYTMREYAPNSPSAAEFLALAKAADRLSRR